ncbi:unnamed protein product [Pieris macdunnoughi]|uniref:Reverse transcriptase domain-containing protein n=1 Tax=Pieris macdunnoughi TaxID=345717 RepID=A0A821N943_9NEOP|nr:unnamed protein product [Pieris macdunnoughi]
MGKLYEILLLSRLRQTADRLQPPFQHGFTKNRGTGIQILRTSKFITDALEARESVGIVLTDLPKAFDSINHEGLIPPNTPMACASLTGLPTRLRDTTRGLGHRHRYRLLPSLEAKLQHRQNEVCYIHSREKLP